MGRARGSAARQMRRARVMDDARRGEDEVEAETRTTVEDEDASDGDGESFGAFATPARSFVNGTDGTTNIDDDDDDDDFGDFTTPATTMKTVTTPGMRDEPPTTPTTTTTTTTTTTGGGEFDLIALTNEGEFVEAARRLLKRGKARTTNDDAEKESFGGLGTAAVVGDGRFTKEAFDRFRDNVEREREASTEASASEEDEEETSVDDAAPREVLAEFDLISLESAPKVAETTPGMDPFAGFGDIAVESAASPQIADNDDEFGDFV